ncbi:MAG: family 16 glycosylhydrolase [Bacteroidetes bacterium]|nr:family 16 glycosylhydrolase [Bacteroidota bacterium]
MKNFFLILLFTSSLLIGKNYKGAEYRTKEAFTYGRFEVRMKSAQRQGMLSSFFTYHEISSIDDWNEIDIEILGRYSDDVQFNPITRGQVNHVSHYRTPFNPALDYHTYAFEWTPAYVAWFVDGREVYRATGPHIEGLNLPQKIMMNVWNPTYANWAGDWNENVLPAFAYYDWVSYSTYTPGSGTSGTDNNFTLQWKDDFDSWDQSRWEKSTHTFGGNNCDFVQSNAVFKDGKLILCLTKESAVGYLDNTGPSVVAARAEPNGVIVEFTEEVDSISAVTISNYTLTGNTITQAELLNDQKRIKLTVANYKPETLSNLVILNVKDRFSPANVNTPVNVTITKSKPLSFPIKINCGGAAYKEYLPDQYWSPAVEYGCLDGTFYQNTNSISGAINSAVYNSELNGSVKYRIRVPNGTYTVILMMAENYFTSAGKRIFSIDIEDSTVEANLDLYSKIGYAKQYQKAVSNVLVTDGILDIHFTATIDNAVVNGIQIYQTSTSLNEKKTNFAPDKWNVEQNYPNPFNGGANIAFTLPRDEYVTVGIYDVLGRMVSEYSLGVLTQGKNNFYWNGEEKNGTLCASGMYFYSVRSGNNITIRKCIITK